MEKRHNYVRKVAETAVQLFLTNDKANVSGLILAGSADFKTELSQSDMFDQRLQAKIIKLVDVSYGGENGFNQVGCYDLEIVLFCPVLSCFVLDICYVKLSFWKYHLYSNECSEGKTNTFLLQAIELSAESLANVKFIQEKKLIGKYFDEISQDTGKYCFGVDDTLKALEMGAVETLICWENLDIQVISF